jgi:hypothetical protein
MGTNSWMVSDRYSGKLAEMPYKDTQQDGIIVKAWYDDPLQVVEIERRIATGDPQDIPFNEVKVLLFAYGGNDHLINPNTGDFPIHQAHGWCYDPLFL